jgi:rhamnosyltransferase
VSDAITATVFIPTYNGEPYLKEILERVFTQKTDFAYEVLIIDSGSKDGTLEIIESFKKKHPKLRLHIIPNTEYGHGKTRNLAAQMAKGDVVVYLSHDASPSHDRWLHEMVRPFAISDKIVGVMGKQIPRRHCIPMLKSEIRGVFAGFGPDFGTTIFYKDDFVQSQGVYDAISFYSDANSAARKSYLLGQIPYQDVAYAEDQLFGRDIIEAGLYKVYAPRGSVVHSNDLRLKEYRYRMFDETLALRTIGLPVGIPTKKTITKMIVRGIVRDTRNIIRDHDYSAKRKLYWLAVNPLFHIEKWRGVRLGATAELADKDAHQKYSLEKQRASK